MPTLPPAPGVTRAVLGQLWSGQRVANVLHFTNAEDTGSPDPEELASRLKVWWDVHIKPKVANTLSLIEVVTTALDGDGAPSFLYTSGLPLVGASASPSVPNNAAMVMSLRTALRGRSYRGRVYQPGLVITSVPGNAMSAATAATWITAYNALITLSGDVGEPDHQLVVLSYYANHAVRSSPVATPVVSIATDAVVDSQRRRLPGRGS